MTAVAEIAAARRGGFVRTRRTRRSEALRGLVRETRLNPASFIYPLFVTHGAGERQPIESMPGQFRLSVDQLAAEAAELRSLGVRAVLLFGIPVVKDAVGSEAYAGHGIVQQAARVLKEADPDLAVIADICLCEYTDHGHCGVVTPAGEVDNDPSLDLLARMAVSVAEAGVDVVAPSDMMDGRVGAIRDALDGSASSPCHSWPTARSTPPRSTVPSARPPTRRRSSATVAATRWIRRTCARHCAKWRPTSRSRPTS